MEEQGWAPTLAAAREQRRRFESGELREGPDADITDGQNHPVLVASAVASVFTALWVGGVVGLVTPRSGAEDTFQLGLFPRSAAIGILLVSTVVAGCVAALLCPVPFERRRGAVTAALVIILVALAVALLRVFPFQVPIGEHVVSGGNRAYLQTGPDVLTRFLPVVVAGALSAVFAALVLARDPRPRSLIAVAIVGMVWVLVGSGATRPPWVTTRASGHGTDAFGDPDLSIAWLGGGVLLVTLALVQVVRMPARRQGRASTRRWIVVAEVASVAGAIAALAWPTHHVGTWIAGRPLRRHRRPVLPRVERSAGSAGAGRDRAGARWLDCAAEEKASIGAFEELAAHLARLSAPSELVDRGRSAARDEQHHTDACLTIAARLGHPGSLGALPPSRRRVDRPIPTRLRRAHLEVLVRESIVDGMIGEALAAERLHIGGANASSASIRQITARLASDERSHAALASDIVRWCARVEPRGTRRQIRWVRRRLRHDSFDAGAHGSQPTAEEVAAGFVDEAQAQWCWRTVRRHALAQLAAIEADLQPSAGSSLAQLGELAVGHGPPHR